MIVALLSFGFLFVAVCAMAVITLGSVEWPADDYGTSRADETPTIDADQTTSALGRPHQIPGLVTVASAEYALNASILTLEPLDRELTVSEWRFVTPRRVYLRPGARAPLVGKTYRARPPAPSEYPLATAAERPSAARGERKYEVN